jgi:hypothetical protein
MRFFISIPILIILLQFACRKDDPVSTEQISCDSVNVVPDLPSTIFIASIPPVATVFMDGDSIGKTNVELLHVLSGNRQMKFVKDTIYVDKIMLFCPGENASQMVRLNQSVNN